MFNYRAPRFLASATFHFRTDEATVPGLCTNLSVGGLLALMEHSEPRVGETGFVEIRYAQQQFTLGAVVTHLEGKEVGFSFLRRNHNERTAAVEFAAFLEAQTSKLTGRHAD